MTLIEAVVAAAVVLTISTAATGACLAARTAAAPGHDRLTADSCVAAQVEALRALPFADQPAGGGSPAADLLGTVFPHADPARDTPTAFFAATPRDGCPAGAFFTIRDAACGPLTVAATFLVAAPSGLLPLDPVRLAGYDHSAAGCPPAAVMLVRVTARWRSSSRCGTVTRTVVLADRPVGLCPVTTPSPA
jgi:hypothetical protein